MDMEDVCRVLREAERSGPDIDEPEGVRTITLSETLVNKMIAAFEIQKKENKCTANKLQN